FDPLVRDWFTQRFAAATEPQILGWPEIRAGHDILISAPTGSGKTLAAFLLCLDRLVRAARLGPLPNQTEVVYVSPLKALSNDIHINLEVPLSEPRPNRCTSCSPPRSRATCCAPPAPSSSTKSTPWPTISADRTCRSRSRAWMC
ncbi:MAG: DEAD/DEAH box helicase, partial [Bryobacteraceae bacterium]